MVEAAKTTDVLRRTALLKLFRRLTNGYRFLDRPNTIVRAAAQGFAGRGADGKASVTLNGDPLLAGLWVALNEPDEIDEEVRAELLGWARTWGNDFDEIVSGGRANVQDLLRKVPAAARRPGESTVDELQFGFFSNR